LKLFIVAVGNKPPAWVASGFTEYAKRMPPEARVELIEVKPEPREGGKTAAQMMAAEAKRILAAIPQGAKLVALDERGKDLATKDLAAKISAWQREGDNVALVIGGADGLSDEVKSRAALMIRLSSLTLPHALVRVILAEALYRAVSLNQGHPYHRE
jgi:23S rRNA (pseudouridine1915-N3)-methyltransferase